MLTSRGESSTIFVIDGDPIAREAVCAQLQSSGHPVLPLATGAEFLEALRPDTATGCLVVDLPLVDMSYQMLLQELSKRAVDVPLLLLTEPANLAVAVAATKAGVDDVLPRDADTLVTRVSELVSESATRRAETSGLRKVLESLTQRELEVLRLVVTGQSNKAIGETLGISFRTVEVHRKHLMLKTHATNVLELARLVELARRAHLIT